MSVGTKDMEKILHFLKNTMAVPAPGGLFHWIAIVLVIVITFLLCYFFRDTDEKTFRLLLVIIWAVMLTMEGVKQLEESYVIDSAGNFTWGYNWGTFPLQLCDSPLWFLLPVAFMKDGDRRDSLIAYMSTYILLGGLATYAFPSSTFGSNVYVNLQTMVHHGLQIASCIFIAVHFREKFKKRAFFRKGIPVFLLFVTVATLYNVGIHALVPNMEVNMCFISPYFRKDIPIEIFKDAFQRMHWFVVIVLYVFAVSFLANLIFFLYHRAFGYNDNKDSKGKPFSAAR